MRNIILVLFLSLFMAGGAMAQKNVLVLEKPGNKKSFKYYEGDKIELRTKDSLTVKGLVSAIKDTVIVINFYTEVRVSRIAEIQRTRWGVSILSKILMAGGAAMVLIESINGAISADGNINMNYLYYGAGAAAAGALMIPLQKSHYVIAPEKWKVKILPVDQQFNYQKNKTIQF